jgi:cytochrome P450
LVLGKGILTAEGDEHRAQRKILTPAFSSQNIRELVPVFWEKGLKLVSIWKDLPESTGPGIEVLSWLSRTTLDVISVAGFGYELNSLDNADDELTKSYRLLFTFSRIGRLIGILNIYLPFMRSIPFPRNVQVKVATQTIRAKTSRLVTEKTESMLNKGEIKKDLLGLMVAENLKTENSNDTLSEEDIISQCTTLLAAGHETVSTSVSSS